MLVVVSLVVMLVPTDQRPLDISLNLCGDLPNSHQRKPHPNTIFSNMRRRSITDVPLMCRFRTSELIRLRISALLLERLSKLLSPGPEGSSV